MLKIGSKVSYGDMANPRKQGIITGTKGTNPNMYVLGAGMKAAGEMFMVTFDNHVSEVSQGIIDGPGGWQEDNEPIASQEEIDGIKLACEVHQSEMAETRKRGLEQTERDIEKGKALFEAAKPEWAKAVIIAEMEIDDCDMQSDYFNTKTGRTILLAWSKHERDLFPEMRKAALNCDVQGVRDLAVASDVDRNGDERTDQNKKWWTPADEHREKYSMGAGYYLKREGCYSTGWKIQKRPLSWGMDSLYKAAGKEGGFQTSEAKAPDKAEPQDTGVKVGEYKGHPTITLHCNGKGFTFGIAKAKAILENIEAIKEFIGSTV